MVMNWLNTVLNQKTRISKILLVIALCALTILPGYTLPSDAPYLDINCSAGSLRIFLSPNTMGYLMYDETRGYLTNCYSSNIYGYTHYQNDDYRVTFPTYDYPYITVNYQNTVTLTQIEIVTNHSVDLYNRYDANMTTYIGIAICCFLFFLLFRR